MSAVTQQTIPLKRFRDAPTDLEAVYFRWIQRGAAAPTITDRAERIFRHHLELAVVRQPGVAITRVYRPDDGSGLGPAIQVVNDDMPLLVDTLTSALRRLGAEIAEVVHPVFDVARDTVGRLQGLAPRASDARPGPAAAESWIHVQLHTSADPELLDRIERALGPLLEELRRVNDDTTPMTRTMAALADRLDRMVRVAGDVEIDDSARLLRWMADGHCTVLGYGFYPIARTDPATEADLRQATGTGLGVLRHGVGVPAAGRLAGAPVLRLTSGSIDSMLPGAADLCFVRVADPGRELPVAEVPETMPGEHVFVGTFTVTGSHEDILDIPLISRRIHRVIEWAGLDLNSFSGQAMLEVLQTFPRVELFSTDVRRLFETVSSVMNLGLRRQVRLFLRRDDRGGTVHCLVYLPRDRYSGEVRGAMQDVLAAEFAATRITYSVRVTESDLAVTYFTVHRDPAAEPVDISESNRDRIQEALFEATRTWSDRLVAASASAPAISAALAREYADAFPAGYQQEYEPDRALADLRRLEALADGEVESDLYRDPESPSGEWRFTLLVVGAEVSLSRVLPLLHSLGVEVVDERPYRIELPGRSTRWIYDFGLRAPAGMLRGAVDEDLEAELARAAEHEAGPENGVRQRFADAVAAMWSGRAEVDGLNELVLRAGLRWREIAVLRAYAKYLRQAGFTYTLGNITRVLSTHPVAARWFTELFDAYFDPEGVPAVASARAAAVAGRLQDDIDAVVSLDTDRILRAFLGLITATLRTNYYRRDENGAARDQLSFKLAPHAIAELPRPRPQFEIFVYSPRVEGVHLRFGSVARGGLRWSDRLEDFRTEVLGLVKAQAVKNAVIVPVGAKGGFVVKQPPAATGDPVVDRQAAQAEGIACYRTFISGLLDVTDNVDHVSGQVIPPERVVRRDGDDTYLVVAADKGTATFSDIANEVAQSYGFWLGDAFASGGSAGYDHKAMGITAKGAWESVKRHFAELDIDTQATDFTVVGVGDMSGDVFGNGMLLSRHIRLVAAFDHRHIFLDPNPDAASSFSERERMFALPRSSWADYDESLISAGGGVYDRSAKAIPVSSQVRAALRIAPGVSSLSPAEMIRAILLAPVDLLWNGGIGTYVKASGESNADAGDKTNDPVRVDANRLRARVIGEGGNLGLTPHGRIEFCRQGGKCNTDALDNSAGVDCSDHEVNIKVLLDSLVTAGELPADERDPLLASMTDEVAELVLRDNISQNFCMGLSRSDARSMLEVHRRLIADLEVRHGLDRALEALPAEAELGERAVLGEGLSSPEIANLLAHVKLSLKQELLAGDLPDSQAFAARLPGYFPEPLSARFGAAIRKHPLRREIVATTVVNEMVDYGGITFAFRLAEEAGADAADAVRAFTAAVEIFDLHSLWERIRTTPMPAAVRDELELETERTLDRACRWLLAHRPQPIAIGADIARYWEGVRTLSVPAWQPGPLAKDLLRRSRGPIDRGAPRDLAEEVYLLIHRFSLLDVLDIAEITHRDAPEVVALYYALDERFEIQRLLTEVAGLDRGDRWQALARLAVRDDLYGALRSLTIDVLTITEPTETPTEKITYWESTNRPRLARARAALTDIFASDSKDLATLSVAARQFRSLVGTGEAGAVILD
ncbi:NAD-glutamate dehydrogenase [Nocardia macrotermitis]|uniref:NAD-specific glutamate dehydrogenase n=1 Tax=Nocardia macrotermitis TaxID=2585198 RepID=A0A7K0DDW1_9NOCA|nr:NAD-glutamate dehydrogenase [Nocardia macrotermitis]MQY23858.1 NAD-specific glutamate dehydrogenase [Nocardia macrotermitis]